VSEFNEELNLIGQVPPDSIFHNWLHRNNKFIGNENETFVFGPNNRLIGWLALSYKTQLIDGTFFDAKKNKLLTLPAKEFLK
jgi:hypothetical protein